MTEPDRPVLPPLTFQIRRDPLPSGFSLCRRYEDSGIIAEAEEYLVVLWDHYQEVKRQLAAAQTQLAAKGKR